MSLISPVPNHFFTQTRITYRFEELSCINNRKANIKVLLQPLTKQVAKKERSELPDPIQPFIHY